MEGQVGAFGEVLAQQTVGVFVGAALPGAIVMSRDIADSFRQGIADISVVGRAGFRWVGNGGWYRSSACVGGLVGHRWPG